MPDDGLVPGTGDFPAADGRLWAKIILREAGCDGTNAVLAAINRVTAARQANCGEVMVACAQVLAQTIVGAGPGCAPEVRSGVTALIDGFATQVAVGDGT